MSNNRYQRQICLKQVGEDGQQKLLQARVAVIGCGALGSSVANNLARAGIGFLRLIDGDTVNISNLHRQQIYSEEDVLQNCNKAVAARKFLLAANSEIEINSFPHYLNQGNAGLALSGVDLIIDATDNFSSRMLINELTIEQNTPWVHGAVLGFEGRVILFQPGQGCYRCLVPSIPSPAIIPKPEEYGVFGPLAVIAGSLQATEAIRYLINPKDYSSRLLSIDIWHQQMQVIGFQRKESCPFCSDLRSGS